MGKILTLPQFKSYNQQQASLLPLDLEELIPANHLVRVVNTVADRMDISSIVNGYKGGGTTAWHPKMLVKVILYAYSMKIYTGRRIAQALRSDVYFMWLAGNNRPDFRTINSFRSIRMKDGIEKLFEEVLLFLMEHDYIKMENYFCDGSSFMADANRHRMVWRKNAERYEQQARQQCRQLFEQIDALNAEENRVYGEKDLEEMGQSAEPITHEAIDRKVEALNQTLQTAINKQSHRKATRLKKQLQQKQQDIGRYEQQQQTAAGRSGYSKTDTDATAMRMKNQETLPAYNVLASTENQFITTCTVHQNSNDSVCFKNHVEQMQQQQVIPDSIIADSIFGTEENYALLEKLGIENYLKFPTYHSEQSKKHQQNKYHKDNLSYDAQQDCYTCPNQQKLVFTGRVNKIVRGSKYVSVLKEYQCKNCDGCPFYAQCVQSKSGGNRTIQVNETLEQYKQETRQNLGSAKGIWLRKRRGVEVESCFGDIKHNMLFRRFHLRGLQKVKTEWNIVSIAHNLRKVSLQQARKAA